MEDRMGKRVFRASFNGEKVMCDDKTIAYYSQQHGHFVIQPGLDDAMHRAVSRAITGLPNGAIARDIAARVAMYYDGGELSSR
jgi:hypothetical protein